MKPWEKYAEAEVKPWEKYSAVKQANKDYDAILAQADTIDGSSIGKFRNTIESSPLNEMALGRIGVLDRGATFGLGRKVGGLINAIGSYPVDRIAQLSGVENTPSFWDRYHETVDPTMQAMDRYQEERPVEAFALEMAGGIANPANKVGAGWIGKGGNAATRVLRSGVVGTGAGGVAGAMNTENVENLRDNTIVGSVFGGALGVTLPVAIGAITKGVGLLRSNTKKGLDYMRRELGDEAVEAMIKEAEETGRPIIEVANDKALKLSQAARMQTPEAMDTIDVAAERFKNTATDRNSAFIDDNLGSLSRFDSIEAMEDEAREKAAPLYKKFYQREDLAPTKEQLAKQNFNRWFEGSKVVDENGQPLKLYHGTLENFDEFSKAKIGSRHSQDDSGFYLTNRKNIADDYALSEFDPDKKGNVISAYVNSKKPLKIDNEWAKKNGLGSVFDREDSISFWDNYQEFVKDEIKKAKADGVIIDDGYQKMVVAFEPNQIKSVNNSGAWSSSPSLTDAGWNPKTNDALANYVKENPFLQQEIGKIRKNPLFQTEYNMSALPDTDARILDQLNKNINDQISTAVRNGENETVRLLERQKYGLLNMVDDIAPEYKEARALYEDARRFKKAANTAEQIFKGDVSKEAFAKTFDSMSKTERDALKIGLRDEIYKIIGNRENEALGWKKIVPAQVQDKIRKVLGKEEGNKLIKYANDEIKAMRNYNKATQGSKTAEKTDLEKAINWRRELLDFASLGSVSGRNKGIANIMTNPNASEVASAFEQLSNPKWGEAVYQRYLGYTPEMIALGNYLANKR